MSVQFPLQGTLAEPVSLALITTDVVDILDLAIGRADVVTVIGVILVNTSAASCVATVWWTKDVSDFPIFSRSVPANDTITISLDAPIKLSAKAEGRKIRASASVAGAITITIVSTVSPQSRPV